MCIAPRNISTAPLRPATRTTRLFRKVTGLRRRATSSNAVRCPFFGGIDSCFETVPIRLPDTSAFRVSGQKTKRADLRASASVGGLLVVGEKSARLRQVVPNRQRLLEFRFGLGLALVGCQDYPDVRVGGCRTQDFGERFITLSKPFLFAECQPQIHPGAFVLRRLGDRFAEFFLGLAPLAAAVIEIAEVVAQVGVMRRELQRLAILREGPRVIALL